METLYGFYKRNCIHATGMTIYHGFISETNKDTLHL